MGCFMFKKISKLLLCALFVARTAFAAQGDSGEPNDPLVGMNYRQAFDQKKVHAKHKQLLEQLGCAANVFDLDTNAVTVAVKPNADDAKESDLFVDSKLVVIEAKVPQELLAAYEKECLAQLQKEKRWTLLKPARKSAYILVLMIIATVVATKMLGSDSMGGSFSVFALLFNGVFYSREFQNRSKIGPFLQSIL